MIDDFIREIKPDEKHYFLLPGDMVNVSKNVTLSNGRLYKFVQVITSPNSPSDISVFNLAVKYDIKTEKGSRNKWKPVKYPQDYVSVMQIGKTRFSEKNKHNLVLDSSMPTKGSETWEEFTKFIQDSKLSVDVSRIIHEQLDDKEAREELLATLSQANELYIYQAEQKLLESQKILNEINTIKSL